MGDYKWSSHNSYINDTNELVDITFALNFFKDISQYKTFMKESNEDKYLDYKPPKRYTNGDLTEIISSIVGINSLQEIDSMTRNKVLKKIKETTGASNRQLARCLISGEGY